VHAFRYTVVWMIITLAGWVIWSTQSMFRCSLLISLNSWRTQPSSAAQMYTICTQMLTPLTSLS